MNQTTSSQRYDLFNPTYVDANRMGRIAPDQRAVFESQLVLIPSLMGFGCQAIFLLIFLSAIGIFGFTALMSWETSPTVKIILGVLILAILLLVLIRSVYRHFHRRRTLLKEMENPVIRRTEGMVTFGKKGYQVQAQGQALEVPWFASRDILAPGLPYVLYYLPESSIILSAEKLSIRGEQQAHDELNKILAGANKFHTAALPLNRNGMLADEQVSQVRSKLVAPIIFIVLPLGVLGVQIYNKLSNNGRIEFTTGFTVMGGILLALALFGGYSLGKSLSDIRERRVLFVEGPGHKDKRIRTDDDGGDRTDYYYVIGEERFQVSRKAYMALIDGLLYRAYFTPSGKTLVNIEALESPFKGA